MTGTREKPTYIPMMRTSAIGPLQTLTTGSDCCGAAHHSCRSLQLQILGLGELTLCGTVQPLDLASNVRQPTPGLNYSSKSPHSIRMRQMLSDLSNQPIKMILGDAQVTNDPLFHRFYS